MNKDTILYVKITDLIPNTNQPRKKFDEKALLNLSTSIKTYGIINPILATKKQDKYEIIAGERRYRAAKMAGLTEVPIILKEVDESKLTELALIDNIHREELNPIEEAKSYQEILKSSNITQQDLGTKLGKSQAFIANKIRLLSLPAEIQRAVTEKQISERHARSLIQVNSEEKQHELLSRIIKEKMPVKELEKIIRQENFDTAIDDITKSLNIEKKEEKESDNMNNGNFFPNFNNQPGMPDNTSLNTMNMQAANPAPMPSETVMPSAPLGGQPTEMPQMTPPTIEEPAAPAMDAPLFNQPAPAEPVGLPEFNTPQPVNPIPTETVMPSAPLGGQPTEMPQMTPPTIEEPVAPVMDAPLFNQPAPAEPVGLPEFNTPPVSGPVAPSEGPVIPGVSIPVETPEMPPLNQNEDNVSKVKEFLNQNNINYKAYSNETNQCIIIEF